jgi:hypothetical protein
MRALLIATYFGPLPNYIPLWLKSCERNHELDFMLLTDQYLPQSQIPSNLRIIPTSLPSLKRLFSCVAGFEVALERPYKVCDFRPLFGLAFADWLDGYDFWGHVDLDVIWGRIMNFLPLNMLASYQRIFRRGHFALFKNDDSTNAMFRLPHPTISYKTALRTEKSVLFDEVAGIYSIAMHNNVSVYDAFEPLGDIAYSSARFTFSFNKKFNRPHQAFFYEDGKTMQVYADGNGEICFREFLCLHLQKRVFPDADYWSLAEANRFVITPGGFVKDMPERWTVADMDRFNRADYRHLGRQGWRSLRKKLTFS